MAPKTKGKRKKAKKKKTPEVVGKLSIEEMSEEQLDEEIARLSEELERAQKEKNIAKLVRDNIKAVSETRRREVEDVKDELRQTHRRREEAQQQHRKEISVYERKLTHVLSEQHNIIAELEMDTATSVSLIQNQQLMSELELGLQCDALKAEAREKMLNNKLCIKELKLKNQVALLELMEDYNKRNIELEVKFNEWMQTTVEVEQGKLWSEVNELECTINAQVTALKEDHSCALKKAQDYYSSLQNKVVADEKALKEEKAEVQKQLARACKQLSVAEQENRRLRESLRVAEQRLPELRAQVLEYSRIKAKLVKSRARAKIAEQELWDTTIEMELLRQATEKVQKECDELKRRERDAKLELQQESLLKGLQLEVDVAALTETLETKEAQLCVALSAATGTDGSSAANQLEETLESKGAAVAALKEDLAQRQQEYEQQLQTCTDRLKALGVPLHDFPFRPAAHT